MTEVIPAENEWPVTLPSELEQPDRAYGLYTALDSLLQSHSLDEFTLTQYHHSMLPDPKIIAYRTPSLKATHLLTGAWCQVELAHVVDGKGRAAEARELLAIAEGQSAASQTLVERHYGEHSEHFDRLYRSKLLRLYVPHFAQIGPTRWPDQPTAFQRTAYQTVQERLVNPLLKDMITFRGDHSPVAKKNLRQLRGILGELLVLQTLNRLHVAMDLDYAEWTVAPASARESTKGSFIDSHKRQGQKSSAFDVKLIFMDQTFVPIEAKWNPGPEKLDEIKNAHEPRIAIVAVEGNNRNAVVAAHGMRHEVAGERVSPREVDAIEELAAAVLKSISEVPRVGVSIYDRDGLGALAAELSLRKLLLLS